MYDLAILGGGPAGMTAAVYAARKTLNTLLLSQDQGGQVLWTADVENYMGYQFIEGPELMEKFEQQLEQFPIDTQIGPSVKHIGKIDGGFEIEADGNKSYQAKAVIVATGKRPRPLGVSGEDRLRGKGVTYCAVCDGPIFAGMRVAVVGGGNSALEAVDDMVKIAEHVDLISLTPLTGDQILIDRLKTATNLDIFLEHQVARITGDDFVQGITIRKVKTDETSQLTIAGVFVEIGLIPNSDCVKGLAELNAEGEVKVDRLNQTNVPGLFAAGDVTDVPEKQIVIAAGEAAKAALQAHRYLQRLS